MMSMDDFIIVFQSKFIQLNMEKSVASNYLVFILKMNIFLNVGNRYTSKILYWNMLNLLNLM